MSQLELLERIAELLDREHDAIATIDLSSFAHVMSGYDAGYYGYLWSSVFGDDMPWTPPELAPALVHVLASGRADALAGRYIHAEHDDIEDLIARADEIESKGLNAIRLQR
jgi:hypothetical protein